MLNNLKFQLLVMAIWIGVYVITTLAGFARLFMNRYYLLLSILVSAGLALLIQN